MPTNGRPTPARTTTTPAQSAAPPVRPAPSSALRVALRRAAHQLVDPHPLVFPDPFAVPLLTPTYSAHLARTPKPTPRRTRTLQWSLALRAFAVARSRYLQDQLDAATTRTRNPVQHLVLLGSGLDTSAWRNPHLPVWELDRPAIHALKHHLATAANLPPTPNRHTIAADITDLTSPTNPLTTAGLPPNQPTLFALLGVVPYLPPGTLQRLLPLVQTQGPGSGLLFDYRLPRHALPPEEQRQHDSLSARLTAAGEPFQSLFTPSEMATILAPTFQQPELQLESQLQPRLEDLDTEALNHRYFQHSAPLQAHGHATRLLSAWL
jgi:methyltransferase (TIGR00027 family)